MKKVTTFLSLLILVLLAACGSEEGEQGEGNQKDTMYTTVYPLEFVAQQIVGDKVEVESILPAGSDAHTYEPTTKEMVQMAEGKAFIYTKDEFEPYAATIAETLNEEGVTTLPVAKGLEEVGHGEEDTHEEDHAEEESAADDHAGHNHSVGGEDPHIWLDPMVMTKVAESLKEEFIAMYPEKEETFLQNTETLKEQLTELDEQMATTIQEADTKEVVVSHAAYGYWEEAYGLKQIAISGLSSTNEPSQKELEHVIETAKEHGLDYVLFEKNVSPKAAEVVQEEIGAEPLYLHNLATRTEDEIDNDENYFDLMQKNIEVLEQALYEEDPA
ncbi:metal ABC transporter solute-binding protein, Zn/Mn family [Salimicrobium halophilum]|uniref:Zinc transport system substrate-binding protein n=1 Tax=Salimicrobium halophilum TaxID=86666 RepID=A0A1G8U7B3_9BACI|nr:zinc ABC transporter substrate-binding protein [Salimicrobium halophilum]SDJ49621.1 zinc transport system substrate-binding protein [Salimicrobium halophilum]